MSTSTLRLSVDAQTRVPLPCIVCPNQLEIRNGDFFPLSKIMRITPQLGYVVEHSLLSVNIAFMLYLGGRHGQHIPRTRCMSH